MASKPNKGPLIKVQVGKDRWVKMYRADAIAKGLLKERAQAQNKMQQVRENKSVSSPKPVADDFTTIPGVGKATADNLHARGILTFDQLANSELDFLQAKVRQAIEKYFG